MRLLFCRNCAILVGRVQERMQTDMDERNTALAVEEKEVLLPETEQPSSKNVTDPSKKAVKKQRFLGRGFLIYLGVLLVLAAAALLYVYHVLSWYESAQPENVAQSYLQKLQKAAGKGELGALVSLEELDADGLSQYMSSLANGEVSSEASEAADYEDETLVFNTLCNGYQMGEIQLTYAGQKTKLGIFTADLWEVSSCKVTPYRFETELPVTLTVTENGKAVNGTLSEDGQTVKYALSSSTLPQVVLTDLFGNTAPYDLGLYESGRLSDYTVVNVPSNYTVKNGDEKIPLSAAVLTELEEYQYLYAYNADVPKKATYLLCTLDGTVDVSVYDNLGSRVEFSDQKDVISLEGQVVTDTMPAIIQNAPDPLEAAKQWSLFMTRDLTGERYGFYKLAEHLIDESYLYDVAWEWATGVDITFTSAHRLRTPPFQVAEVTNFVAYGDKAFSCDILLEKDLVLYGSTFVKDTMYSTFYFVYYDDTDNGKDDPHWAIADKRDIAVTE